jgi:hypothetical protein
VLEIPDSMVTQQSKPRLLTDSHHVGHAAGGGLDRIHEAVPDVENKG